MCHATNQFGKLFDLWEWDNIYNIDACERLYVTLTASDFLQFEQTIYFYCCKMSHATFQI